MKNYLKSIIAGSTMSRVLVILVLSVSTLFLTCKTPIAAEYPEREITFVVTVAAGGGTDVLARYIGNELKNDLGIPMIVVNKAGAGGAIGLHAVANAKPDGYTIGTNSSSMISRKYVVPNFVDRTQFEPVAIFNSDPNAFVVRADAPWKTIHEALAWAKANPNKLSVANGGTGSIPHLCIIMLEKKANVKFTHVPFTGANPAVLAAAGGHVDAATVSPAEAKALVDAGKVRMLAVSSGQRDTMFPNVPTYKESGINFVEGLWRGIVAPKGTPKPIIQKLAASIKKTAFSPEYKKFLERGGFGWSFEGPEEFGATMERLDKEFSVSIPMLNLKEK